MNDEQQTITYPADYLRNFATEVFTYFGVPKTDAEQASDVLAKSDLRGIDSHGIARLHAYFEMLELGRINSRPKIWSSSVSRGRHSLTRKAFETRTHRTFPC
jgi:L-2-hydroxycarboxylate dehydrogenase (NAD+)